MNNKTSTANGNPPSNKANKNMPVAVKPAPKAEATTQTASSSSSSVAIIAALVSIVTAGGAFFLWKEVSTVQQTVASTVGLDQSDLDKLQKSLEQSITTTSGKTAAELKTTVAETKGLLEKQIADSTSQVASQTTAVKNETQESLSSIQNNIVETQSKVQQTRTEVENMITSTKGEIQQELNQAISTTTNEIATTKQELAEVKGSFGELRQQVSERLKSAEDAQASLHAAVQESQMELKHAVSRNKTDWAVAEVEHILRLANEQIQIESNVPNAITTLRTADQRLKSISDPALIKVREAIELEIASLSQVSVPDVTGVALTLGRLSSEVEKLQTIGSASRAKESAPAETSKGEEDISTTAEIVANNSLKAVAGFATAAWEGFAGGLVIKNNDKTVVPVIPPRQAFFVKQNLQLKLETARLALLQKDNATFHDAIKTAISWTGQYFSEDAPTTQKFIDELSALDNLNVAPSLPDISGSLKALKEVQPNLS
jgi:uroporphyrin-3 C-methyltransferase